MRENIQANPVYRETAVFGQLRPLGWRAVGMDMEMR